MISIIVPAYNAEKYINRCVHSVLNQSEEDFELLIIDDGSTDATTELSHRWQEQDTRVRVIRQENQGLSGARNTGLRSAQGDFIFFLDSDDWIENNTLEILLKKQKETHADIVACGFDWVYEDGKRVPFTEKKDFLIDGKKALEEMILGRTLCSVVWNKLYRKELFRNINFPLDKKNEDEFTTYKLLYNASLVAYIGKPLYFYYQNDAGLMKGIYREQNFDKLEALWERGKWLRDLEEMKLAKDSDMELLNHTKYLYRNKESNDISKSELKKRYLYYSKQALLNQNLSWKERFKIQFWRMFL